MTRKRKDEQRKAWAEFWPKLNAIETLEEATALGKQTPPPDTPGRPYYTNLNTFLISLSPPDGANIEELQVYKRLIAESEESEVFKRLIATGASAVAADVKELTLRRLELAIQRRLRHLASR